MTCLNPHLCRWVARIADGRAAGTACWRQLSSGRLSVVAYIPAHEERGKNQQTIVVSAPFETDKPDPGTTRHPRNYGCQLRLSMCIEAAARQP